MRRMAVLATLVAIVAVTGPVGAQQPTTAAVPTTTVVPDTTLPPSTTLPAEAPVAETTLAVGDEASYRAALTALSADAAGPHTIDLTADITVDDGTDPTYTGTEPLTIDGHGFTLDAAGTSRLLVMDSPDDSALTLAAVTIADGDAAGDGGGVQVLNASPLSITDSSLVASTAQGSGGALAAAADVTIQRSTFEGNHATTGDGGAIFEGGDGAEVDITDSLLSGNQAPGGRGGAIALVGQQVQFQGGVIVRRTALIENQAQNGGALYSAPGASFVNSTFADNAASIAGGAVSVDGASDFGGFYGTIAGNSAPDGANVAHERGSGLLTVIGTVIAEPRGGGENCNEAAHVNAQLSHVDDGSCNPGNDGPALLGPLQDNGGLTPTRAPLPGSPLIDAVRKDAFGGIAGFGDDCGYTDFVEDVDQRGEPRPVEGDGVQDVNENIVPNSPPLPAGCDIGAVEAAFVPLPTGPTGPVAASPGFTG